MNNDTFLTLQGETIARAFTQQGYIAQKLADKLAWQVYQPDEEWWLLLTFLPRPVAQWRLLPDGQHSYQSQLYAILEQAIGGRR